MIGTNSLDDWKQKSAQKHGVWYLYEILYFTKKYGTLIVVSVPQTKMNSNWFLMLTLLKMTVKQSSKKS